MGSRGWPSQEEISQIMEITTGTGLIQITSNDFTNNRDLSSNTVIINGQGNIVNNAIITGDSGKIIGNDITNNDLVAFEKYLEINAKNKVQNNKDKTIYGGQTFNHQRKRDIKMMKGKSWAEI